jgi:hypothetical protein
VLFTRGGLDGGDDLPRDAKIGKAAKRRLPVKLIVYNRFVQADHALLNDILAIRTDEKIRARLAADDLLVARIERLFGARVARTMEAKQILVTQRFVVRHSTFFRLSLFEMPRFAALYSASSRLSFAGTSR